jgi:hypothetical protein
MPDAFVTSLSGAAPTGVKYVTAQTHETIPDVPLRRRFVPSGHAW